MTQRSQIAGPAAVLRIVLAQNQQVRHEGEQLREDGLPACVGIRPQDGSRLHRVVRVVGGSCFQRSL